MFLITLLSIYFVGASGFVLPQNVRLNGRIIGGVETTIEEFPYQVSLQWVVGISYFHVCGGSILTKDHVLTAAHCITASLIYVRAGTTQVLNGGQIRSSSKLTKHPQYNPDTLDYDVAVVTLYSSLNLGGNVVPVVLPSSPDPVEGEMVTVSGWGVTDENSPVSSPNLMKVDLPVWSNDKCKDVYSFLTPRHICLGGTAQGGTSACFGDSGGPVTYKGVQIGTVSGGYSCSMPNIPGIYGRLIVVLDWVKEQADLK